MKTRSHAPRGRVVEGDDGLWLHLAEDGDRAAVAFLGAPFPFEACFVGGRPVPADAALRARGLATSIRIARTVAVFAHGDDGAPLLWERPRLRGAAPRIHFELRIFEHGAIVHRSLTRLASDFPLAMWVFEIARHGARRARHTTYSVTPLRRLCAVERRALGSARCFELALYCGAVPAPAQGALLAPTLRSAELAVVDAPARKEGRS